MRSSTRWTVGGVAIALALGATGVAAATTGGDEREQQVVQSFAAELGVPVEQLDEAYVAVLEAELADAVAAGEITQAEADEELAEAAEEGFELDIDVDREDERGDDRDDEDVTDASVISAAKQAAEGAVRGGQAGEVERADEDAPSGVVYEVEVTEPGGGEVDVLLDQSFGVVTTERWADETPGA